MKQIITQEEKHSGLGWGAVLIGYSLIGIAFYVLYRFGAFLIGEIGIPESITDLGLAACIIILILAGMRLLLRLDMQKSRRAFPARRREILHG